MSISKVRWPMKNVRSVVNLQRRMSHHLFYFLQRIFLLRFSLMFSDIDEPADIHLYRFVPLSCLSVYRFVVVVVFSEELEEVFSFIRKTIYIPNGFVRRKHKFIGEQFLRSFDQRWKSSSCRTTVQPRRCPKKRSYGRSTVERCRDNKTCWQRNWWAK